MHIYNLWEGTSKDGKVEVIRNSDWWDPDPEGNFPTWEGSASLTWGRRRDISFFEEVGEKEEIQADAATFEGLLIEL